MGKGCAIRDLGYRVEFLAMADATDAESSTIIFVKTRIPLSTHAPFHGIIPEINVRQTLIITSIIAASNGSIAFKF